MLFATSPPLGTDRLIDGVLPYTGRSKPAVIEKLLTVTVVSVADAASTISPGLDSVPVYVCPVAATPSCALNWIGPFRSTLNSPFGRNSKLRSTLTRTGADAVPMPPPAPWVVRSVTSVAVISEPAPSAVMGPSCPLMVTVAPRLWYSAVRSDRVVTGAFAITVPTFTPR